jgi:hypothetical protein
MKRGDINNPGDIQTKLPNVVALFKLQENETMIFASTVSI